ncbi:MAG: cytochrome-c peroxidase [bacterium]|nr:cytochrome-c peroxidase [bacterium]
MERVNRTIRAWRIAIERDPERIRSGLNRAFPLLLGGALAFTIGFGWPDAPATSRASSSDATTGPEASAEPIRPIPRQMDLDPQKVALGDRLFHDPQLSRNGEISCASCHDLQMGGTDRLPRSLGIDGQEGTINSPTVFNADFNFRQFWDGRAADLEEQIDGPMNNPLEMGFNWEDLMARLNADQKYMEQFLLVYGEDPTPARVRDAIAEFERSLFTPNARFDRYLRGDANALTPDEKSGYSLFKQYGCIACHQGTNVGGNMYQKFGVLGDYFADRDAQKTSQSRHRSSSQQGGDDAHRAAVAKADLGRFNVTGREEDRHKFKVPSLRNVELTPPYFHDGSAKTLQEAVRIMGRYQLGVTLPPRDVDQIVLFLKTLTGEYRGRSLQIEDARSGSTQNDAN